jgi:hypothetical protein
MRCSELLFNPQSGESEATPVRVFKEPQRNQFASAVRSPARSVLQTVASAPNRPHRRISSLPYPLIPRILVSLSSAIRQPPSTLHPTVIPIIRTQMTFGTVSRIFLKNPEPSDELRFRAPRAATAFILAKVTGSLRFPFNPEPTATALHLRCWRVVAVFRLIRSQRRRRDPCPAATPSRFPLTRSQRRRRDPSAAGPLSPLAPD